MIRSPFLLIVNEDEGPLKFVRTFLKLIGVKVNDAALPRDLLKLVLTSRFLADGLPTNLPTSGFVNAEFGIKLENQDESWPSLLLLNSSESFFVSVADLRIFCGV